MFNTVITTANRYEDDQMTGGIIDVTKKVGALKDYQTVIAVGPMVRNIEVGDVVLIDMTAYGKPKHEKDRNKGESVAGLVDGYHVEMIYEIPMMVVNGEEVLNIKDRDVSFVAEIEEDEPVISIVTPKIIC